LGRLVNRRPTYRLTERPEEARTLDKIRASLKRISAPAEEGDDKGGESSDSRYAVLPPGETLQGWTQEDKDELNDIVRHMLHSRRAKFKRSMKGFWQYVRRPLGLFITLYATLITLFGAAWVLFLIGWISIGSRKDYIVNVVDNVLVGLFAVIGDGLAPFRAVDTYHMIYIARYHRKTWKRREKMGLPELADHNDLPDLRKEDIEPKEVDLESLVARRLPRGLARRIAPRIPKRLAQRMVTRNKTDNPSYEYSVLSVEEQTKLEHHERKFSKSHTFYKPHETETHYAFPLKLLVAVVVLLDFHSALQISLGACTWGISYKTRPFALTTVILCCSITCNIMAGVLISMGDKRTRKKDVIERMMRQELTSEAIEQIEKRWLKEAEERGEIDPAVRRKIEEEREEAENEEIKKAWKLVPSLPKHLLGKGEDHRQPSLPQKSRRAGSSSASMTSGSSSSTTNKSRLKSKAALPPVQEVPSQPAQPPQPARPEPALRPGEPPKERTGQKVMRLIRRADLDQS
ncbi:integral membrane protein-like protein, partial [Rhizodiscina lignyota]